MADMGTRTVKLRTAVWMALGSAAFVGAFFAGVLVARAKPEPGGGTAAPLSFAGTLKHNGQPMTGKQALTFTLRKGEASCTVEAVEVEVDADGHFTAPIPLGQEGGCPAGFFDGSDVALEVTVKGATFAGEVSPVPYAKYAEQVGTPDCPAGYERDSAPSNPANPASTLCRRGVDEIVRVGSGPNTFWIDRYEATVWTTPDGPANPTSNEMFRDGDDSSLDFPRNGQVIVPLFALSVTDRLPARFISWFQAMEACAAVGKRIPRGSEWLMAARGTFDPGMNNVSDGNTRCNTSSSGPRETGHGLGTTQTTSCVSDWGAQDMVGNIWEWTDEWYAGLSSSDPNSVLWQWPADFGDDGTANIDSRAYPGGGASVPGLPAATQRGGAWFTGIGTGVFAFNLSIAPSGSDQHTGFRCVTGR